MTAAFNLSQFANKVNTSGQADLTTAVTGALPIANGGTGSTTASLVGGTGISISGTFPNQTVTNTATSTYVGGRGQVFTSSGTFTIPASITALKISVTGGGGGTNNNGGNSTVASGTQAITTITGGGGSGNNINTGGTATNGNINIRGGQGGAGQNAVGCSGGAGGSGGSAIYGNAPAYGGGANGSSGSAGIQGNQGSGAGATGISYLTGLTAGATLAVTIGAAGTSAGAGVVIFEW